MKIILLLLSMICATSITYSQKALVDSTQTNIVVYPNNFKLYPTGNMWNFLKLDTRNGKIWKVQFHTDSDKRFERYLNDISLVFPFKEDEIPGRFELHKTENIYNFVLLDKIDGRVWQVQWSMNQEKEFVNRIR